MTLTPWVSVGAGILLVGFIIFAFQQGLKVKPNKDAKDNWQSFGGPPPSGDNPSN